MRVPFSAFLHFGLVELSPIWVGYLSFRHIGLRVARRARAGSVTIEGLCRHVAIIDKGVGFDIAYTLKDLEKCLEQSVLHDQFENSPSDIINEELSCGQIGFHLRLHGILRGSMGMINWAACAITSVSLIGSLLLFMSNGALGDASDFRSGHYLAFTWALEGLGVYRILVGLHVGFYAILAIVLIATVSESRESWPGLVILAMSSMSLLSIDRPPLKWDSSDFRNSTFNRPWYEFYKSNNKFACKGLAEYLTPASIIVDRSCCYAGQLADDGCQLANDCVFDNVSNSTGSSSVEM